MPELTNPFLGIVPRKLTNHELARAIRQDIIGELDAVSLYEAHIDATDDEGAKRVLKHVMNEEKDHVGDFMALLEYLDPDQARLLREGMEASGALIMGMPPPEEESKPELSSTPQGLTVGNLIG